MSERKLMRDAIGARDVEVSATVADVGKLKG